MLQYNNAIRLQHIRECNNMWSHSKSQNMSTKTWAQSGIWRRVRTVHTTAATASDCQTGVSSLLCVSDSISLSQSHHKAHDKDFLFWYCISMNFNKRHCIGCGLLTVLTAISLHRNILISLPRLASGLPQSDDSGCWSSGWTCLSIH